MGFADQYLAKQAENILPVSPETDKNTEIIVIIPAYNESGLTKSLDSLFNCTPPVGKTDVLILINWPENCPESTKRENQHNYHMLKKWIASHTGEHIRFHALLYADMPAKHAGVGLARKTLMDEAVRRFNKISCPKGIIASFDADSVCDPDYLQEIEMHFLHYPEKDGCVIYFEHPVSGHDFSPVIYKAVTLYELHLRYYLESIRYTGFPNSYHTIGSSFAVRAEAYCRQGGMNKRKAGEDFYFLQKFFELGTFNELNATRVVPSPRPSIRVPFGTGAAISRFELYSKEELLTYNPASFEILKSFFSKIPLLYHTGSEVNMDVLYIYKDKVLKGFLECSGFYDALLEIRSNSASYPMFEKRFYRWFNLFRILKFLNYAKDYFPDTEVSDATLQLMVKMNQASDRIKTPLLLLKQLRKKQRGF